MTVRLLDARVLMYSHDSFGLGHLRRCRAVAHALVDRFKGLSVLILSGSPIISSFDFRARVDFVRVPGVIKLHNGEYTSLKLHIDLEQTLRIRESIIRHTAEIFEPDIFIVDKEPLGLRGEVEQTLALVKSLGGVNVLGLRDVMDDPISLDREWRRKKVAEPIGRFYDQIWVYGPEEMGNPISDVQYVGDLWKKVKFTGYIKRDLPIDVEPPPWKEQFSPYLLVTAGGGGDGEAIIDWVLRAYEEVGSSLKTAVVVLGPFMPATVRNDFEQRAGRLDNVHTVRFESHMEFLVDGADAVVAMGGYNTFCEILSFRKPALIVPRIKPRREQEIRAVRAENLGLVRVLPMSELDNTSRMIEELNTISLMKPIPDKKVGHLMGGLETICDLVNDIAAYKEETSIRSVDTALL